ncbi:MAG: bifunctional demethylmenaquinone methyltransferase/2-methoxy-6-polyprenyl-1,4-benzoquinol methylase UbiE [Bacteroidia bacterium]|nr:bifunctional demethylmenaquinone methyltransferase/2-methoxy-6-polyprenyl-1,4-benzoquinol methylase UbiE [Bacteroidia bacterium]
MAVVPYKDNSDSKRVQVETMFDNIAPKYDFLNHTLSAGIDVLWRRKAIKILQAKNPKTILDIATGTADFAIEAIALNPDKIIGVDISEGMLAIGRKKIEKKNLQQRIVLQNGDCEKLDFANNSFDAITCSFGVRNFEHLQLGLAEMLRILKPNGTLVIIEFAQPEKFPIKQVYNFYFKRILPVIGKLISKDTAAYTYLPDSVKAFPYGAEFVGILSSLGYTNCKAISLTFGVANIYTASK